MTQLRVYFDVTDKGGNPVDPARLDPHDIADNIEAPEGYAVETVEAEWEDD